MRRVTVVVEPRGDLAPALTELERYAQERGFSSFFWFEVLRNVIERTPDPALQKAMLDTLSRIAIVLGPQSRLARDRRQAAPGAGDRGKEQPGAGQPAPGKPEVRAGHCQAEDAKQGASDRGEQCDAERRAPQHLPPGQGSEQQPGGIGGGERQRAECLREQQQPDADAYH